MDDNGDTYTHGHHESVLRSHRWRTAENSAAHLLPHLQPGQRLLDVGCGPGNLTADLARRIASGHALGIDASAEVIAQAQADHGGAPGLTFAVGDAYALDRADGSVDVVHAHQVLQHLSDPVAALSEWRRVLAPGGVLAIRDSDYTSFAWAPADPLLDRWLDLYVAVTRHNQAECAAGRYLLAWAHQAGFADAAFTSSTWTFADEETRTWWSSLWADRVRLSSFAEQAIAFGLASADDLTEVSEAWRRWGAHPDATFIVVHGEVIARC